MNVYKIKFDDGFSKKTFIIAEVNFATALAVAVNVEMYVDKYGNRIFPSASCFNGEKINGVFARNSGIKSIIY